MKVGLLKVFAAAIFEVANQSLGNDALALVTAMSNEDQALVAIAKFLKSILVSSLRGTVG